MTLYRDNQVRLLPSASHVSYGDVLRFYGPPVCACDFYVCGAEAGTEIPGGYQFGHVMNIDHHGPVPRMARRVSSANLALDQVNQCGLPIGLVLINHTDCDSILSAGIASGVLEPLNEYGEAAIVADHTGAVNEVADLLQALDDFRDVALSFASLERLRERIPLDFEVERALDVRKWRRGAAEAAVVTGQVPVSAGVAVGVFDHEIDGEFFPALLPEAAVILVAIRMETASRWLVKVRLGQAAPAGLTLDALNIPAFDTAYGGRWNAGSNKRGGGTRCAPDLYAEELRRRLEASLTPSAVAESSSTAV